MTTCYNTTAIPKLPLQPANGDEVCDRYGNKWQYDGESDTWISKGVVYAPTEVSESQDGIISPEIFDKLTKLKKYVDSGVDLSPLKLLPGTDAYWYYFRSSDKCIRFTPEGPSALRVEIDRGRLYQILLKEICPGVRGPKGETGDAGPDGVPGADEVCYAPSAVDSNQLDFAIFVPIPLTLDGKVAPLPNDHVPDISVRVYNATKASAASYNQIDYLAKWLHDNSDLATAKKFQRTREELSRRSLGQAFAASLCDIPLSKVITTDSVDLLVTIDINPIDPTKITITVNGDFAVNETSTIAAMKFDPETGIVCGSIFIDREWSDLADDFCVKARQRGPDGIAGIPGDCVVRVCDCEIDSSNIAASHPLINARLDCQDNIVYTLAADILEEVCVDKVSLLPNSGALADQSVFDSVFASAQVILDECKYINRYEVALKDDEPPELELVHWDPQPGCFTKRYYDRYKFDWIPETDIPACDALAKWFGPDSTRPGIYPYKIITAPEPDDAECCEENFFWCENVQATSPSAAAGGGSMLHSVPASAAGQPQSMNSTSKPISLAARKWNIT